MRFWDGLALGYVLVLIACGGDSPEQAFLTPAVPVAAITPLAEADVEYYFYPEPEQPWQKTPSVLVLASADDSRLRQAEEAIKIWNHRLEALGSGFRFGEVSHVQASVPAEAVRALQQRFNYSAAFEAIAGPFETDTIIVLSNLDLSTSFSTQLLPGRPRVVVVIRDHTEPPMSLPGVTRNIIAHELGHSFGLGHNNDPAMLMCGRPASCRPTDFETLTEGFFPLTSVEEAHLLRLHPASWSEIP